jgi:hypothetical protein
MVYSMAVNWPYNINICSERKRAKQKKSWQDFKWVSSDKLVVVERKAEFLKQKATFVTMTEKKDIFVYWYVTSCGVQITRPGHSKKKRFGFD